MKVQSARFGLMDISETDIISFQKGILGFPESKKYVWIHNIEPDLPIEGLQSTSDEHISFMMVDPFLFAPEYEIDLSEDTKELLGIVRKEQVLVRVILTSRPDNHTTINLKAPLIMNMDNNQAAQVILDGTQYQLQYPIGRG